MPNGSRKFQPFFVRTLLRTKVRAPANSAVLRLTHGPGLLFFGIVPKSNLRHALLPATGRGERDCGPNSPTGFPRFGRLPDGSMAHFPVLGRPGSVRPNQTIAPARSQPGRVA